MVNASLNWASIVGIVLAVGGALLYFMRSFKPALARDYDVFFAAVGLLCGGILFFQGWRLDPILQFGQFLLAGTTVFFAYESVRLRGVTTEQARRSSYFDDDEPAPRPRMGGGREWGEGVDRFDEPQALRRRIRSREDGYDDQDRSRDEDAALLAHVGDWLHARWPIEQRCRPFFVAVTTRTNHFPFDRVAGVERTGDESWPARMHDTMRYTDAAVGTLLARLRQEPWFAHTVVVITGDHGYPLGEHGAWYLYETLHIEATGVPLVLVGDHPELLPLRGRLAASSATQTAPSRP